MKARVLSGVQPSGNLHIGNYLGALRSWVKIQRDYESIFCIVDLHAITVHQPPEELRRKIEETAGLFVAAGIDPGTSSIVVQSSVSGHAELAWWAGDEILIPGTWERSSVGVIETVRASFNSESTENHGGHGEANLSVGPILKGGVHRILCMPPFKNLRALRGSPCSPC